MTIGELEINCEAIRYSISMKGFRFLLDEYLRLEKEVADADVMYTDMDDMLRKVGNNKFFSACKDDFANIRQKMARSLNYRRSLIHDIEEITQLRNLRYFVYNVSRVLGKSIEELSLDVYHKKSGFADLINRGYIKTTDLHKFLVYTRIDARLIKLWRNYTDYEAWK